VRVCLCICCCFSLADESVDVAMDALHLSKKCTYEGMGQVTGDGTVNDSIVCSVYVSFPWCAYAFIPRTRVPSVA
jgi:hypothetical protein